MKVKTSILSRALAMLLALVLSFANVPGLVMTAFAAEKTVSAGEVIAKNYDLTDAEKALLKSGYLAGDYAISYDLPEDSDVEVDADKKEITAKEFDGWTAVSAEILANGEFMESFTLTNGKGTYAYDGNAFAVEVNYVLNKDVEGQQTMLDNMAALKQGVANLDAAYGADADLGTVAMGIDTMVMLADGLTIDMGWAVISAKFGDAASDAVYALNEQVKANEGTLNLQKMNLVYANTAKTEYFAVSGEDYAAEVKDTYDLIAAIANDALLENQILDSYLQSNMASDYTLWKAFKNIVNNLVATLEPAATATWNTKAVAEGANYAALDALVAGLGELTAVEVKNPLTVDEVSVQANMNMKNVNVKVVLNVVEDAADSTELVEYASKAEVVTLDEGVTAEKIIAEAKGVVDAALAEWAEVYTEDGYKVTVSEIPATLTEDIEVTYTYAPVDCEVTGDIVKTVPYGYKLTLEPHADATKAYDYVVNGEKHAQGEVVTILGATEVTRTSGKSYNTQNLYAIIANNYGDDVAKAILTSGALKGDETISYRKPDPADSESLVKLENGQVVAQETYASAYAGLNWVPYSYGAEGTENLFSGNTAEWNENAVKVVYRLSLSNYSVEDVQKVLDLAEALKEEAEAQTGVMDGLAGMKDDLEMLDKTKFGALNGVIDVTDFTPGDGTDADEANKAMQKYFKNVVSSIINNNLASNNLLKIFNYVEDYAAEGLKYYYENAEEIISEVTELAGYLGEMTKEEEALKIMVTAAGYPQYADKIADVETKLNGYLEALTLPNAAINTASANLGKLAAALSAEGETSCTATGAPYVDSAALTATDSSQVYVQIIIDTPNGEATITTTPMDRGTVLTQEDINTLKASVEAQVSNLLNGNNKYYVETVEGSLDELVDEELNAKVNVYYTYSEKEYTVVIEGEADQTITVSDLEINLPKHATSGWEYRYTVDGVDEITTSTYTFTLEQLDRLFAEGSYTITRTEVDEAKEKIEETFAEWLVKDVNGNVTGLYAKVDGNKNGVMDFAMTIVESGYTYIGLNGEPLLYMNDENTTEVKLQTLINAMLNDNQFSNETLITLGKAGKGEFVHASMQLGNSASDIVFEDLDFTLYLSSVPSQMATVANGLEKIKPYMTFKSESGVMAVYATLPEKVYEVYLAALIATGNVDKDDMEAVNSEIAAQFLWDYVELIMATDANTTTYTNTLAKLGIDKDLTGAEKYYQLAKKALTNPGVVVNPEDDNELVDLSVTANGKKAIDGIISLLGIDVSAYETYMGMIYEYKGEGAALTAAATAELTNTNNGFEAALVDVRHPVDSKVDYLKKFDFTNNLSERVKSIAGEAAIILLDDVTGDLVFNDVTILDLNGHTVNGNIVANGRTLIFDSKLDTFESGSVTGTVSGTATIVGGKYASDVTALLPEGFEVENGAVRNVLYTIEENNGDILFKADADILNKDIVSYTEAAGMIAADMAVDLLLNYFTSASLYADGYQIYNVTVEDIIGIYDSTNRKEQLINTALGFVSLADLNAFINGIIDEMLDFAAIEEAIDNDTAILDMEVTVAPWSVTVDHVVAEDYVTFGIAPNADLEETFTVGLAMDGSEGKKEYAANLVGGLSDIVDTADAQVEIHKPSYSNNHFKVSGEGYATLIIDVTKDNNTENDTAYTYEEYVNVLAVVFANGVEDEAKAKALVDAIGEDNATMKAAIDALTVKDVFDALKNMSVKTTFADMVAKLGITEDLGRAAALEEIYHLVANAAGEGLEYLDITGPAKTLGSLWNESTGYYEYSTTRSADKTVSKGGYSLTVGAEITKATLKVKLFGEEDEHVHGTATREENVVPATCGKDGSYDLVTYCPECGTVLNREHKVIPATGKHENIVTDEGYPATCSAEGLTDGSHCEDCGTVIVAQEIIPIDENAHNWYNKEIDIVWELVDGKWTCKATHYCEYNSQHSETVEATITSEVIEKATCCEPGTTRYTARFNADWVTEILYKDVDDIPVDPDAHKWGNWVTVKEPTYYEEGLAKRECELCGDVEYKSIPKKRKPSSGGIIIDLTGKDDEGNPETGAPVFD